MIHRDPDHQVIDLNHITIRKVVMDDFLFNLNDLTQTKNIMYDFIANLKAHHTPPFMNSKELPDQESGSPEMVTRAIPSIYLVLRS
jgi:hypothetical protein